MCEMFPWGLSVSAISEVLTMKGED